MTDTTTPDASTPSAATDAPKRTGGSLGGKVLAELQEIAAELGITGAEKMRKGALIDAIKIARGDAGTSTKAAVKAASGPAVDTTAPAAVIIPDVKTDVTTDAVADEAPAKAEKPARAPRARKTAAAKAAEAPGDATVAETAAPKRRTTRKAAAASDSD